MENIDDVPGIESAFKMSTYCAKPRTSVLSSQRSMSDTMPLMGSLQGRAHPAPCPGDPAHLVDQAILEALGLGHELLGAAVAVARGGGVTDQVPIVHLKDHCLDQACSTPHTILQLYTDISMSF